MTPWLAALTLLALLPGLTLAALRRHHRRTETAALRRAIHAGAPIALIDDTTGTHVITPHGTAHTLARPQDL